MTDTVMLSGSRCGDISRAVRILREGGLVAFPTETVYGLGADAQNDLAVRRIFDVKGRPTGHPLIVHLANLELIEAWVPEMSPLARSLARAFWPGPLTLIVRRGARISTVVTGGGETVGVRVPGHPVAQEMLVEFGGPVAAPSANRFGRVSPTRADHVIEDLAGQIDAVLDGGPCAVGLESTILDVSGKDPAILRPGGITSEQLAAAVGRPLPLLSSAPVPAPGQHASHYAPRAEVLIVQSHEIAARAAVLRESGRKVVALLRAGQGVSLLDVPVLALPTSESDLAHSLYELLREVDRGGFEVALVTLPDEHGLGLAIADRLRRAAGPREQTG